MVGLNLKGYLPFKDDLTFFHATVEAGPTLKVTCGRSDFPVGNGRTTPLYNYVPSLCLPRCFASALKKRRVALPAAVLMAVGAPQL